MRRAIVFALMLCGGSAAIVQGAPRPASAEVGFQDQQPQYTPQDPQQGQPQDQQQQYPQDNAGYENYSPDQLDNLLSPIALYPDPLLAQVFVAATFPDQVEEAARFVRAYGANGVDSQNWDVSVRSVAHYPTVIGMMADKIDWTTSLGQAYVNQSTDVAGSVQRLRHMARSAGNLATSPQQEVIEHDNYIAITPYQPEYIYVPVYDPAICYYRRPYWGPAITFGVGYPIGAWLNLDFRWGFGGGWGGVYYTGWRREGWGNGCWNCGWIGRSYNRVNVRNNVYVNNRYTNITVNRTVINRTVNVNNINRYNSIHKNVTYNNVQVNNTRINNHIVNNNGRPGFNGRPNGNDARPGNNNGRPGNDNRPGFDNRAGNNGRPGNDVRPIVANPGVSSPGTNNKIIDRNIDRSNPRIDQYRGRDNNVRNDRPANVQQRPNTPPQERTLPAQQTRPLPQQQNRPQVQQNRPAPQANSAPHTFNRNEGNFDPRTTSRRGQASRQQAQPQASRPAPPQRQQQSRPAPQQHGGGGGGERRKP
jgi:hypothetical protein